MSQPYRVQARNVARGNSYGARQLRQVSVQIDEGTLEQVRARAMAEGTSLSEQVRLLVEWGLEVDEKA